MAGNPFDQFDPSASSAAPTSGANPFDQFDSKGKGATASAPQEQHGALYNTLFKEGAGGTAYQSADEGIFPALRDYALAGADDLTLGGLKTIAPKSVGDMIVQAHSNLGPMGYVEGAAAYGLGPGKVLAPIAKGLAGAGVAGMATEGALAGGGSTIAGGDVSPWDVAKGAVGGAALGGVAGGLTKGVNAVSTKMFGTPASIDPAAAAANLEQRTAQTYAQGKTIPIGHDPADNAFGAALDFQDPVEGLGNSDSFLAKVNQARDIIAQQKNLGNPLNAEQIDGMRRRIYEAASTPIDNKLAGSIGANLGGVIDAAGGSAWNQAAQDAFKAQKNAETLQEMGQKAAAGAPLGQAPLTQANAPWNAKDPDAQKAWLSLYKQGQEPGPGSPGLTHALIGAAADLMGIPFGFLGHLGTEALGYMVAKPALSKWSKGVRTNATTQAVQNMYPQVTGQPLTGAQSGPQATGEMIKNLMLGGAY